MSIAFQRLPNGRHIVSLIGDPGPVPGEDDSTPGREAGGFEGSTGLVLSLLDFWSREVALMHDRIDHATTVDELEAVALATLIAIEQWRAAREAA